MNVHEHLVVLGLHPFDQLAGDARGIGRIHGVDLYNEFTKRRCRLGHGPRMAAFGGDGPEPVEGSGEGSHTIAVGAEPWRGRARPLQKRRKQDESSEPRDADGEQPHEHVNQDMLIRPTASRRNCRLRCLPTAGH